MEIRPISKPLVKFFGPRDFLNFNRRSYSILIPAYILLLFHRLIRNLKPSVDDRKRLSQLLLVDAQRRIGVEGIPANQCIEPVLSEELAERYHFIRSAVERRHWLPRLAVADQLEDAEQPNRPHRAHRPVLRL